MQYANNLCCELCGDAEPPFIFQYNLYHILRIVVSTRKWDTTNVICGSSPTAVKHPKGYQELVLHKHGQEQQMMALAESQMDNLSAD